MIYIKGNFLFAWALMIATMFSYFPGSKVIYASRDIAENTFLGKTQGIEAASLLKTAKPRDYKIPDGDDAEPYSDAAGNKKGAWQGTKLVVIDAGHGGEDPGAISNGLREKDITLDISLKLDKLLKNSGVGTFMTRYDDTAIDLKERINLANRKNAALFISIHSNWYQDTSFKGIMTLYYPSGSLAAGNLYELDYAQLIQGSLAKRLEMKDLGINDRPNLAVLRHAQMPSVLAEIGFMSNKEDARLLASPDFRQKAAEALAEGIKQALDRIDGEK